MTILQGISTFSINCLAIIEMLIRTNMLPVNQQIIINSISKIKIKILKVGTHKCFNIHNECANNAIGWYMKLVKGEASQSITKGIYIPNLTFKF